jgi:hypothetical protein
MSIRTELINALKQKFKKHINPAKKYADDLLPQVDKFVWSTEPLYYMEQLAIELGRLPKGRILKAEPAELYRCYKTGYDKDGNILTEEYWAGHPSNGHTKFFVRDVNEMYSYTIDRNDELEHIEYTEYSGGKPIVYGRYSRHVAACADSYFYDDGKLKRIENSTDRSFEIQETAFDIDYDTLGAIEKITRTDEVSATFPKGQTIVVYKKTDYSIKALIDIFTEEMVDVLTKAIKKNPQQYAMVAVEAAFSSDDWLPLRLYVFNEEKLLARELLLQDFINSDNVIYEDISTVKLKEVSLLLLHQATSQEKYDLPYKLLTDISKKVKQNIEELDTLIIPADLYDDYNESVLSLLEKIYSKKELKNLSI